MLTRVKLSTSQVDAETREKREQEVKQKLIGLLETADSPGGTALASNKTAFWLINRVQVACRSICT